MSMSETSRPTSLLFVDGTSLDHRLREAFSRDDVHFIRLFDALTHGTRLQHVHYCSAPYIRQRGPARYGKQMGDFNFLGTQANVTLHLGYHRTRTRTCRKCGKEHKTYTEKATDVMVATLLVTAACHRQADRLILVSNDNDFWPAIKTCREEGVEVDLAFVVAPGEPNEKEFHKVGQLMKHSRRYAIIDQGFMSSCWRS